MKYDYFFELAKAKGIEECELKIAESYSLSFSLFHSEMDDYQVNNGYSIIARGLINGKFGTASCDVWNKDKAEYLIEEIIKNAAVIEDEDPMFIYKGDEKYKKINTYNKELFDIPADKKIEKLYELEKLIKAGDKISEVAGVSYSETRTVNTLLNGAKLPEIEIKPSVIRGVESNGMCCSLLELGVDSKYLSEYQTKGIEELPSDAPVGEEDVLGYLGLDDIVMNLKVLANRPDLLSIYNVAREVGAIFARPVKIPETNLKEDFKTELKVGSDTDKCSQFSGCEIRGIVTKPSPKYVQQFLMAEGVRPSRRLICQ